MSDTSFLPEDYLAKQAERRTNVISLTLFVVVMAAVFGAFLVTNRQASQIKAAQEAIDVQFQAAALKIDELSELEEQKGRMLQKAEVAAALVERVPRSILLAELINRMPARLSLIEFELKSTPIKPAAPKATDKIKSLSGKSGGPERVKTREEALEEQPVVEATKYLATIVMVGHAPTDLEVSRYIAELNGYKLVHNVMLKHSIQIEHDDTQMREFRVEMTLDPNSDIRLVDPLMVPRGVRNPMTDRLQFQSPLPGQEPESALPAAAPGSEGGQ